MSGANDVFGSAAGVARNNAEEPNLLEFHTLDLGAALASPRGMRTATTLMLKLVALSCLLVSQALDKK